MASNGLVCNTFFMIHLAVLIAHSHQYCFILIATVSDLEASRVQRETEIQSLRQKLEEHQETITNLETVKIKLQVLQEDSEAKSTEILQLRKVWLFDNEEFHLICYGIAF